MAQFFRGPDFRRPSAERRNGRLDRPAEKPAQPILFPYRFDCVWVVHPTPQLEKIFAARTRLRFRPHVEADGGQLSDTAAALRLLAFEALPRASSLCSLV